MSRIPVSKFDYISHLVVETKRLYDAKKDYNWYFNELISVYNPLIKSLISKVYTKKKFNRSIPEIRTRIEELFFHAIIKYEKEFNDSDRHTGDGKKFKHVFFSTYLKAKLPWDVMRLISPPKSEHDEMASDSRYIELDPVNNSEISDKLSTYNSIGKASKPISDNFISLCRFCSKKHEDDTFGEVMLLYFGFGFKNYEIAEFLGVSPQKISLILSQIKNFWKDKIGMIT